MDTKQTMSETEIFDLAKTGQGTGLSQREIAEQLNKAGAVTPRGFPWTQSQVSLFLRTYGKTISTSTTSTVPKEFDPDLVYVRTKEMRASGYKWKSIANLLNKEGIKTQRGLKWSSISLTSFFNRHKAAEKPVKRAQQVTPLRSNGLMSDVAKVAASNLDEEFKLRLLSFLLK